MLLFNLEVLGSSALLVGIFGLRRWLGRAPLHVTIGVLMVFLTIGGRLDVEVPIPGGHTAPYSSTMHLALIMVGVVLVYALEGTGRARRLIAGVAVSLLFLLLLRGTLALHLSAEGVDLSVHGRAGWTDPPVYTSLVAAFALFVDGLVIIVVYQALINAWTRVSILFAFAFALVAGMLADALVFGAVSGLFDAARFADQLIGKTLTGTVAAIPAAAYISWQFRRHGGALEDGLVHRKTFEIVDLTRELRTAKQMMLTARAQYEHVKQVFSRYVAPDVVDDILSDVSRLRLGGELREVTVLFSDIRGYSTLSEHMSPEQTIGILNQYFEWMTEVLNHHRGTIIEFEGDAILAVFNAPLDQPDHACRAVSCALDMLDVVKALNLKWEGDGTAEHWRAAGLSDFRVRLGLHTGKVVVGNVGSETRAKYAVIGDTVNIAARLEAMNKALKTTLLMSHEVASRVPDHAIQLEPLGAKEIRGRKGTIDVYTVAGLPLPEPEGAEGRGDQGRGDQA